MRQILIICGPTASGKTALALKLAQNNKAVIINADSMQLYKDIQIISAAPTLSEQALVPHELYGILKAIDSCSVADYVKIASKTIEACSEQGFMPIIVGGTGMYINSLMYGFSPIPDINPDIRLEARDKLHSLGNEKFFAELVKLDPLIVNKLNSGDSQRILRAYEVVKQSGVSILDFHAKPSIKPLPNYNFKVVMLNPNRNLLYESCNERFFKLLDKGGIDEVNFILRQNLSMELQIFKALGVSEIIAYLEGKMALENAINLAQTKTRQYAKRQVTWFKHQMIDKQVLNYSTKEEYLKLLERITLEEILS